MLMMMVLSLTISCRYIWWRYTSTLDWFDPVSLACGLLLLPPRPMPGWCCCSATGRPHGPCTALRHNCRRIRPSGPAWI